MKEKQIQSVHSDKTGSSGAEQGDSVVSNGAKNGSSGAPHGQNRAERKAEKLVRKENVRMKKLALAKERKLIEETEELARDRSELKETPENPWFRLDNAGLIFVPAQTRRWTSSFRMSCVLKTPVDPSVLQEAVNDLCQRFPTMNVQLRAGLFWYYLETAPKPPVVTQEDHYPCQKFGLESRTQLIRVQYYGYRIAVEFFHAVTDGNGAIVYLCSLVKRYLERLGHTISDAPSCLNYLDIPTAEEKEDSFVRHAKGGQVRPYKEARSVRLKNIREEEGILNVTHGQISVAQLKEVAHKHGATIGEFLSACILTSLYRETKMVGRVKHRHPVVKLGIPVDLRRKFDSKTLRNFVLITNVEIDLTTEQTFETVLSAVKEQFKHIDEEYLRSFMNKNVRTATNPVIRMMPLPIKNLAMKIAYDLYGERVQSMAFSNLGVVKTPPEFDAHVERLEFVLGPSKMNGHASSAVCMGDKLVLSLTSDCKNSSMTKFVFRMLAEMGVDVLVDSNRRWANV